MYEIAPMHSRGSASDRISYWPMLNFQSRILWAREWENLIVPDVKLTMRDFDFYCHLLHKISIVNSKFRNGSTNILCSVLNSRLLKPTILKFSYMFIEFRYNLRIRVRMSLHTALVSTRSRTVTSLTRLLSKKWPHEALRPF